ncbi:hypothetical protein [Pusillimonas sp. ANT_WB101]|uniref:hypothetical protein n=1 Tax=Pusillimonas sp. ANT_WB101 TaxID=2597356 RepID=UPI0011EED328|nr:hypothetical protein [Pusillimonas sp. ANT_WB101]KAA0910856.1 hypothetical protein FQ179_03025 [Pusillimonas sp. ANT_WB101]
MPKLKPATLFPRKEEDNAINRGIASDPDTYEQRVTRLAWVASSVREKRLGSTLGKSVLI